MAEGEGVSGDSLTGPVCDGMGEGTGSVVTICQVKSGTADGGSGLEGNWVGWQHGVNGDGWGKGAAGDTGRTTRKCEQ